MGPVGFPMEEGEGDEELLKEFVFGFCILEVFRVYLQVPLSDDLPLVLFEALKLITVSVVFSVAALARRFREPHRFTNLELSTKTVHRVYPIFTWCFKHANLNHLTNNLKFYFAALVVDVVRSGLIPLVYAAWNAESFVIERNLTQLDTPPVEVPQTSDSLEFLFSMAMSVLLAGIAHLLSDDRCLELGGLSGLCLAFWGHVVTSPYFPASMSWLFVTASLLCMLYLKYRDNVNEDSHEAHIFGFLSGCFLHGPIIDQCLICLYILWGILGFIALSWILVRCSNKARVATDTVLSV
ncbi:hypothetical protein L596_024046 [Steinernema carpocapsae]|uniref:Peptidase S54 rhomboid domain-containing protein n=1 Tax=Steinernema carpocapsae TaxID=34508 RepID=A0A4U5MFJ1_STECR|nr:hypothetical protein L596_024046 [Steinernema carpocapsae]